MTNEKKNYMIDMDFEKGETVWKKISILRHLLADIQAKK